MHLVQTTNPQSEDPTVLKRRALIAAAIGVPAAALPTWANAAAHTPDPNHLANAHTWRTTADNLRNDLQRLATHYATNPHISDHQATRDSALWIYTQADQLTTATPRPAQPELHRLAADAAYMTAGCYIDIGHMQPAADLYQHARRHAANHPDLTAWVDAQANWIPMYTGNWPAVLRTANHAINTAHHNGGPGLLMGWTHRAHALAHYGQRDQARHALTQARRSLARVPASRAPHSALHYSASKLHFSSAGVYAALGDRDAHAEARALAYQDPQLGWMDRQIMDIAAAALDHDAEHAAHRIRMRLARIPHGDVAHCVKVEAENALASLKARQVLNGAGRAGREVNTLSTYLHQLTTAA